MKIKDITEAPLADFQPLGDFSKPGPFRGVDKKLVPHPTNQLKTAKFLENTPYDFRLFFSNLTGTGKYPEIGKVDTNILDQIFGTDIATQILKDSNDAITVVFVGNSGEAKVMMTPWVMMHRFGHAINAINDGPRAGSGRKWGDWKEAEKHFFSTVNNTLADCYGKKQSGVYGTGSDRMNYDQTAEYNALFNAIGTQKSSRSNLIKRPYEFMYEMFAQYLKDGHITLNPIPMNLTYGRKAWGNPTRFMNLNPEFRNDTDRANASHALSMDMGSMFDDVLNSCVGNIYVM